MPLLQGAAARCLCWSGVCALELGYLCCWTWPIPSTHNSSAHFSSHICCTVLLSERRCEMLLSCQTPVALWSLVASAAGACCCRVSLQGVAAGCWCRSAVAIRKKILGVARTPFAIWGLCSRNSVTTDNLGACSLAPAGCSGGGPKCIEGILMKFKGLSETVAIIIALDAASWRLRSWCPERHYSIFGNLWGWHMHFPKSDRPPWGWMWWRWALGWVPWVHTGKRLLACFNLRRQIRLSLVVALGRAQDSKLPYRTVQDHTTSWERLRGKQNLLVKSFPVGNRRPRSNVPLRVDKWPFLFASQGSQYHMLQCSPSYVWKGYGMGTGAVFGGAITGWEGFRTI